MVRGVDYYNAAMFLCKGVLKWSKKALYDTAMILCKGV